MSIFSTTSAAKSRIRSISAAVHSRASWSIAQNDPNTVPSSVINGQPRYARIRYNATEGTSRITGSASVSPITSMLRRATAWRQIEWSNGDSRTIASSGGRPLAPANTCLSDVTIETRQMGACNAARATRVKRSNSQSLMPCAARISSTTRMRRASASRSTGSVIAPIIRMPPGCNIFLSETSSPHPPPVISSPPNIRLRSSPIPLTVLQR